MKKTVAVMLGIMLLVTMVVMTGCTKQTTVVMTVDGFEADAVAPVSIQNMRIGGSKEVDPNGIEPTKFTLNGMADGDYSMQLIDLKGKICPFTLKIHNGKAEAVTPDGVTVTVTVK